MSTSTGTAADWTAAIASAVQSARDGDLDAFTDASRRFGALDIERVAIVQATTIRSLLEEMHPDGLDADDVATVLTRCAQASTWFPDFDADAVLIVLSSALGVSDPEQQPSTGRDVLAMHAAFVIAELSATGPDRLSAHLTNAVDEIRRAETMELP